LTKFLLDGLHGAMLPMFHETQRGRKRILISLNELVRRVLVSAPS